MRRWLGLAVGALTLAVAGAGYLAWRSQERIDAAARGQRARQ